MNILTDQLPEAVRVCGQVHAIRTSWREAVRAILAFEDNDLATLEKQALTLEILYPDVPEERQAAFAQAVKFLNGGQPGEDGETPLRLYSFEKDAALIAAAFQQTHGIDLTADDMHWWKFLALFSDLGENTTFCKLVSLRKRVKTGKATPEEVKLSQEIRDVFDLPEIDTRTLEERDAADEFFSLLRGG